MMSNKYPSTWVEASLPDVAYFQEGPGLRKTQFREEGIPFLNIQTLSNERVNKEKCKFLDPEEVKSKYEHFLLETDDIICSSSGTLGKTAIVREDDKPLMLNTSVIRFRPHVPSLFSRGYLHIFLKSQNFLRQALNASSGSAQVNFGPTHLVKFVIPVPPYNEQHRIVAKIEELFSELDKGVEYLKTAQAQLKVYRQTLLKHAFEGKLTVQWRKQHRAKQSVAPAKAGVQTLNDMDSRPTPSRGLALRGNDEVEDGNDEPLETAADLLKRIQQERAQRYQQQLADWEASGKQGNKPKPPKSLPPLTAEELTELPELPEGWGWVRLGNTNVDVSDGPFGSNLKSSDYVDAGVRVIRLENIGALEFIEDKESFIIEAKYELLKNHTVKSGDIIFSSFITENVRVAMLPVSIQRAVNKADCFCVRLYGKTLSNAFAVMFLSTRHVFKQLEAQIHGVGRPRINTTQLKEVVIPICGIEEQQVIISLVEARLSEVDQLNQTITTALQQAETLRQSILKKAFSGQLVPQDPNDEPASELLARIKAERLASQGNLVVRRKGRRS